MVEVLTNPPLSLMEMVLEPGERYLVARALDTGDLYLWDVDTEGGAAIVRGLQHLGEVSLVGEIRTPEEYAAFQAGAPRARIPSTLATELEHFQWSDPWWCFVLEKPELSIGLERQMQIEVGQGHPLHPYRRSAWALAKREDCDDVLFWVPALETSFVVVHLTWAKKPEIDPNFPGAVAYTTLDVFAHYEMAGEGP